MSSPSKVNNDNNKEKINFINGNKSDDEYRENDFEKEDD